jgi:molecular chaperone GrpE
MSDPTKQPAETEPTPHSNAASAPDGPASATSAEPVSASEAQITELISRLQAESAELKDRLLRTHAEMDNVRKRLEREKAEASKFAISKFARDVVGIGDNVQRALDVVPHQLAEQEPTLKSFVEGVTMIERELLSVLSRHGIKRLDPKGELFNPHHHQAVVEVPSAEVPAGHITQVFQSGYMIEERILRPAMVAVSKGGSKPPAPAEEAASAAPVDAGGATAEDEPKRDNGT